MRRVAAVLSTVAVLTVVCAAPAAAADREQFRFTGISAYAAWGWHRAADSPDGVRTFRTGSLHVGWSDARSGPAEFTDEQVYVHTNDYLRAADGRPAGGIERWFVGSRESVTLTIAPDYTSARLTGTMDAIVCHSAQWPDCEHPGPVAVDLVFTATETPVLDERSTTHPTRWSGQLWHVFARSYAAAVATGTVGDITLPASYDASYWETDGLVVTNCRDYCPEE